MDRTEVINGHTFVFRPYKYRQEIAIRDASLGWGGEIKAGTWQALKVFYSLASWDITDNKGNPISLAIDNYYDYFPKECADRALEIAEEVNQLEEPEKKESSGQSVSP